MGRCKPGTRMHRHYKPTIGTFILSLILGLLAFLPVSHAKPLTVYVDEANPPFMYRAHERAVGIYPDIVRAISALAGLNVKIVPVPWRRVLFHLDNGDGAVAGIYKNLERQNKYAFSREDLMTIGAKASLTLKPD